MIKALKKFHGITINFFELSASTFDNYGFILLKINWMWLGKLCLLSDSAALLSLFFIVDHEQGGTKYIIRGCFMFMRFKIWEKEIVPKKDYCDSCGNYCDSKEFYISEIPYCSEFCID